MASPTALITGVTGQDGAFLSRFLLGKGYRVLGLVRPGGSGIWRLRTLEVEGRVEMAPADLIDPNALRRIIREYKPEEIYNLAAQSSVGESFGRVEATIAFNLQSAVSLMEALADSGVPARLFHASSGEMFGAARELPVRENSPLEPLSPYAVSKAAAHWTARLFRRTRGLFIACGILFNHESALRDPRFVTRKIITGALAISRGAKEKLYLGDTGVERDWGYAPRYVEAMWRMLQIGEPGDYILATGNSRRLDQLVEAVFAALGLDWKSHVEVDPALYRPADIPRMAADPAKARRVLGWDHDWDLDRLARKLIEDYLALEKVPGRS